MSQPDSNTPCFVRGADRTPQKALPRSSRNLLWRGLAPSATVVLLSVRAFAQAEPPDSERDEATVTSDEQTSAEPETPPLFSDDAFSDEKTKLPSETEWRAASLVTIDPNAKLPSCEAKRVREWIRLTCKDGMFGAVRFLGGERDGTQTWLTGGSDEFSDAASAIDIVLPVRRGDARVIEVMTVDIGYKGSMSVSPWMILSEQWPEEDDAPSFSISIDNSFPDQFF